MGDILLGGIIRGAVDSASGSSDKLKPSEVLSISLVLDKQQQARRSEYLQARPCVKDDIRDEVGDVIEFHHQGMDMRAAEIHT